MQRDGNATVPIKDFRNYIAADFYKVRNYRIFPVYFIYLLFLVSLLLWNRSHSNSRNSTFYVFESARREYREKEFKDMKTDIEFYGWLEKTVRTVYRPRGFRWPIEYDNHTHQYPNEAECQEEIAKGNYSCAMNQHRHYDVAAPMEGIGFMLIRQQRVSRTPCEKPSLSYSNDKLEFFERTNFSCRNSDLSTSDYGDPSNPWRSNEVLKEGHIPDPGPMVGRLYSFDADKKDQFSTKFYFHQVDNSTEPDDGGDHDDSHTHDVTPPPSPVTNATTNTSSWPTEAPPPPQTPKQIDTLDAALAEVARMRRHHWIDHQTTIVSVEFLFFVPIGSYFTHMTFLAEHASSGLIVPTIHGIVFNVQDFGSSKANFSFFVDLLMVLCALVLTIEWGLLIRVNYSFTRSLRQSVMRFWIIVSLALIILLWIVFVWRMQLWQFSNENTASDKYDDMDRDEAATTMFNGVCWAGRLSQDSYMLLSLAVVFYTLKMLMYVQHVAGINLVSETIQRSAHDIAGVGLIAMVLLMTFATAGTVFFGAFSSEFATWSVSFVSLWRMLISSQFIVYDQLSVYAPRVTAVYFTSFYFFLGLLTLNLVLGIIVTGYASSKQASATKLKEKEFDSIGVVIRRYVLMKGNEYKDEPHLAPQYRGKEMSTCVAAASAALRVQIPFGQRVKRLNDEYNHRFLATVEL